MAHVSETIINLFNNKESYIDNLRKEIEKLGSPSLVESEQNSSEIDKLMKKLFDPNMQNEFCANMIKYVVTCLNMHRNGQPCHHLC